MKLKYEIELDIELNSFNNPDVSLSKSDIPMIIHEGLLEKLNDCHVDKYGHMLPFEIVEIKEIN